MPSFQECRILNCLSQLLDGRGASVFCIVLRNLIAEGGAGGVTREVLRSSLAC